MAEFSDNNLIFLVSQPRAGSTMLQRILAAHPLIHTIAEPWIMLHPVYALRSQGHQAEYNAQLAYEALQDFSASLDGGLNHYREGVRRMGLYLYATAVQQAGARYFLDKTPRYHLILPELAQLFSHATFILLMRNPLAVLDSILRLYVKGHWPLLARYQDDLLNAPQRLVAFASSTDDVRKVVVHYEKIVQEPQAEIAELCRRLGLAFNPTMLRYGEFERPAGQMGDPDTVSQFSAPTTARLDAWKNLGRQPQTRHFALQYLESLEADLIGALGYDMEMLRAEIEAQPCADGKIDFSWQQIFEPDPEFEKRLYYSELALLTFRRTARWLQKFR